jgi:hypothetical protein
MFEELEYNHHLHIEEVYDHYYPIQMDQRHTEIKYIFQFIFNTKLIEFLHKLYYFTNEKNLFDSKFPMG